MTLRTADRPPKMRAGAFMVPLLRTKGGHADESGGGLVVDPAEFRQHCQHSERGYLPDRFDGLEQFLGSGEVVALTHQAHHGGADGFCRSLQGLQVKRDFPADLFIADDCQTAILGMNHLFELLAAGGEFGQLFTSGIFGQHDMTGLAASHFVGGGRVSGEQAGIRRVRLGPGADQFAIGLETGCVHSSTVNPARRSARTSGFS